MNLIHFFQENWETIGLGIGGVGAWYKERRERKRQENKYIIETRELNAKVNQLETQNNKSIMDLYQEALDDLKKRYDEKFNELQIEIDTLREKLRLSDEKYNEMLKKYKQLKEQKI